MTDASGKIAVLGLGGGGGRIVSRLSEIAPWSQLDVAAADTDADALEHVGEVTRIALGQEWTRQEGCGGDIVLGERAASASAERLREFIQDARLLIVVAGLGGGTGSGAAKVVARLAREAELSAMFLLTLPFAFEGNWRRQEADKCLAPLRRLADAVIVLPSDLLFTALPADTAATEAFRLADALLAKGVAGLTRLVSAQALVTADFAALKTLLRQRQATCALGVGQGEGETRWRDAVEAFLDSPLIGGRSALSEADAAVLTMLGGDDMSVGEVQTCLTAFQQHFPESTRLVVGAYADTSLRGRVQITGLICRYQDAYEPSTGPSEGAAAVPAAKRTKKRREANGAAGSPIQGELPLQEQSLGIFSGTPPTTVAGQNLDIPTFQRRGIHPDVGD